jgi:type IV secretory pathway VirB10-like protein
VDASEPQEPSYYEVALTNRQVLVAFVALLTCLLVAFLSGVWIGRGGTEAAQAQAAASTSRAAVQEPPLEQLSFFNGSPTTGSATVKPPAPAAPAAKPAGAAPAEASPAPGQPAADESEAMRQNLEATMAANRETPAMKMAVGERTGAPSATADPAAPAAEAAPPAAKSAPPPAAKPAAGTGKIFVQVYSSNNGERAREITAKLRKAGFAVVLAEAPKGSGKNFRVRVGPFETRAKADEAAIRLRRDHRLDTWVTDSP